MTSAPTSPPRTARQLLRRRLLDDRTAFADGPGLAAAQEALTKALLPVLAELEPQCLGVYWPMRSEFNAPAACVGDAVSAKLLPGLRLALPFCRRKPREMHYRAWNGQPPTLVDECGIAASDGAVVVPDVVLAPCVGFTPSGFRLGYGGGYFDRWMAANPHVTAIGVAWSVGEVDDDTFAAEAHDQPLMLIVTERGVA